VGGLAGATIAVVVLHAEPLAILGLGALGAILGLAAAEAVARCVILAGGAVGLDEDGPRLRRLRAFVWRLDEMYDETQP